MVWGGGIVAGGDWIGCCKASGSFIEGCCVVGELGMRVGACADELRLMVLSSGSVGDSGGHSVWARSELVYLVRLRVVGYVLGCVVVFVTYAGLS